VKVLLKQDVPNLGEAGTIKNVADGYARNYLIPRRMAVIATAGAVKQAQLQQEAEARREAQAQEEAEGLSVELTGVTVTFHVRAGENEQLYGSITNADIARALEEKVGRTIDRRKIELEEPIRRLGSYRVPVRLAEDHVPHVGVVVEREGA
jgi:large subunit ribosomal protein L9